MVAKPSGLKNKHVLVLGIATRWSLNAIRCYIQPLALAAAQALATSTPLTEAGRQTQRYLYILEAENLM